MKTLAAKASLALLIVGILAALYVFTGGTGADQTARLTLVTKYLALFIVLTPGVIVLADMAEGKIDLSQLLGEHGSGASMSRFQLLLFTLAVGLSFVLVMANQNSIPDVPPNVLVLLGISGSTYAVSKGIQATSPQGLEPKGTAGTGQNPPAPK